MAVNFYSEVHFADNVGIGTSSPSNQLHIFNTGNAEAVLERNSGAQILLQAQAAAGVVGTSSNHDLDIKSNGSTRIKVENAGNVGIGTTSPTAKLDVNGILVVREDSEKGLDINGQSYNYKIGDIDGGENQTYIEVDSINSETTLHNSTLDVNGDTNITGHLDVTTSSASGSPLIRFNQTTTRRGFIQMADTNNNLRVASEYGSVSLEAASSEGSDSDTSYIRIQPGGTVEIGAVDGDATIATDGNMTFRIDADNDETSQKFAFQNNASTEIASLDESGNLSLDGGIELGNASDTTIARSAAGKVTIEGAPIQTTQIVTSHHNMSLDGSSSTVDYYFPINSLADGSSSGLYYTRVLPAYDGKIVKMLFRGSANMGSNCTIYMSRRAHDGSSSSHQTSSFQASETFNGATKTTVVVPCGVGGSNAADWVFEEGDQLGFSLVKNTTSTNVDLTVTIVYEYTIS